VPPTDTLHDIRNAMALRWKQQGVDVEVHHHEVGAMGQNEIGTRFAPLGSAPTGCRSTITQCGTCAVVRQDGDLHAQAIVGR